ncbi:MAG: glycosyltransferase family 4 protein [Polyangiaceae bacterium]|nr:glycosyltransferase family 4 protein [Polyangiaceae bacterium]
MKRRLRVMLVTSGLGNAQGGIGVVAEMIAEVLYENTDVLILRHHYEWPRPVRIADMVLRSAAFALARPDLVIYEHADLAQLHVTLPYLTRIPFVVFLHGDEIWEPFGGRRKEALLRADLLLTNSAFSVRKARVKNPWIPEAKVVWLGVPAPPPHVAPFSERGPVALYVGRMAPNDPLKGTDLLLDAWGPIQKALSSSRLFLVGDGADRARLRERTRREGLSRVDFLGHIGDAARDALYQSSRAFLFPSQKEGFGLAAVEAASFGVPIVGIQGTVLEELFPGGSGTSLAAQATGESVAEAALKLLADPERAEQEGMAARDRVLSTFLRSHFRDRLRAAMAPLMARLK